ncbi:MAG: site-2 protease family protein [Candidatus Saccharibacteria bacterium]|nr:site-2 protease family protein [Candidatus Saccharibacteria bacterium]
MSVVIGVIVGLLILMLLVTGHELGHFIAARRNGVEVEEFGICFPPRAIAWRKVGGKWRRLKKSEWDNPPGKGLILSLNWLPIGGFCQMKGESAADKSKGSFGASSFWSKTKILFAGVAANWLMAFVVLTILAWVGMPHFLDNQFEMNGDTQTVVTTPVTIGEIKSDSPAARAQLREGDVVMQMRSLGCEKGECENPGGERVMINVVDDLLSFDDMYAGQTVYMTYDRDGTTGLAEITLNDKTKDFILGAGISGNAIYRSTWSAPIVGFMTTMQITGETFKGVGQLVWNLISGVARQLNFFDQGARESGAEAVKAAGDSVSGPVGIIGVLFPNMLSSGIGNLMFLTALISISLACMNVLPIPALDGGRWLLILIYKLRKKELTKEKEEKIVGRAFTVLLVIVAIVTIIDITRLVK